MKYLIPLALTVAPLCPNTGLSGFTAVAVFAVGVVLALVAYGKPDTPLYLSVQNFDGDCCDGD